jgi:Na+-transporting methylmalonyl-CoA/oxaloacetate decarboxylase gamma subunit
VLERILFSALPKLFSFLVALTAGIVLLTLGVAMGLLFLFAILFVFVRTVGKEIKTTECNPRRRCR